MTCVGVPAGTLRHWDAMIEDTGAIGPETMAGGGNALLAALERSDLALLARRSARVRFARGEVLAEADVPADALFFVEYGVASVVKPDPANEKTEIALVGPEGFVGVPLVAGDGCWPYRTLVQVDRLCAIRVPAADVRRALERSRVLERLLVRAAHAQTIQVAENLVSVAWQRLDARLARWLLMFRDRLRSDRLEVTHEFMAMMVGVQRTGITEALHGLEGAGLLTAGRGVVVLRDCDGLRRLAGRGYGDAEREQARLFEGEPTPPDGMAAELASSAAI